VKKAGRNGRFAPSRPVNRLAPAGRSADAGVLSLHPVL